MKFIGMKSYIHILYMIIVLAAVVSTAGCIGWGDGGIIIGFGNETYTIPLNTSNSTNSTIPTSELTIHRYEELVYVGGNLTIQELNLTIRPDYDPNKGKFFFIFPDTIYWEPMNVTINNITIIGTGYFTGTTYYIANITILSPEKLTVIVNNPEGQ
ncbi:hypothetical protein, conserved [Thermococcus kodakarensis KOD1]|uniref:Lipoprotein n=1 Tax=Thermococcus kodakarensis (strain ATCC BAA-918 / JCM 12380 / KOD1) TaxID=69014 RepID=Q5JFB2_THEKO|nr:hypothetical protein [Thermococcus kodakarensis]WCN28648.1 hypothetical protein POG15_03090 [Thermococcus kodakarensis]WCN30946.1 hypothetical protein POG21_03090 [Thermococcus kodakarensis]BAD84792.1 hypothetical protein, conserved [Thermococcus kodakarensis KOD1]